MSISWSQIDQKLQGFYKKYGKRCASRTKGKNDAQTAARQAYFPAVVETAHPKRKGFVSFDPKEAELWQVIDGIIVPFLTGNAYDAKSCLTAIDEIREFFKNGSTYPFTYGNAQKWLNMAVKYYMVHLYHRSGVTARVFFNKNPQFLDYPFFAVDSVMVKVVEKTIGIPSPAKKWHEIDCRQDFVNYWNQVGGEIRATGDAPLLWELASW